MHSFLQLGRAVLVALTLAACGGATPVADPPPVTESPPPDETPTSDTPTARPSLTEAECTAEGGTVVGDIGDGATQRPDYKCPSGSPPKGSIAPPKGGPISVEGSVCCAK